MLLDELKKWLPIPGNSKYRCSTTECRKAEKEIGIRLPDDYKDFVNRYGSGCIDDFFWVLNPCTRNPNLNLVIRGRKECEATKRYQDLTGESVPYKLFPAEGGLFPWGLTDNGDVLYWKFDEPASIVVHSPRADYWEEFQNTTIGFMVGLLRRKICVTCFPREWPYAKSTFTPEPD